MPHRPANRKAQLAEAAAELFGKRGYHAVSVNDIACAAGVTGPAVYRHFGSKQDMLAHVLITGLEVFGQVSEDALAGGLDRMLDAVAALAVERREITALWRWQGSHLDKEDRSTIRQSGKRTMDRWADSLRATRPELTADDAEMLSWAALSVFGSISVHHLSLPRKSFERLLAGLAAAVLAYPGLPAPAPTGTSGRPSGTTRPASEPTRPASGTTRPASDTTRPASGPTWPGGGTTELASSTTRRASGPTWPGGGTTERAGSTTWRAGGPLSRREELLAAATKLFRERGFRAVSMEDIGASAGIAGPSIYRHFASKADILVAAGYRMADRLRLDAERALAEATDPGDAINRLVQSYVDTVLRSGNLMAIFASESIDMAERDAKELLRVQRSYVAEWVKLLVEIAPALGEREARITVHAALTIINDLSRTARIAARPGIAEELGGLATTVLRSAG